MCRKLIIGKNVCLSEGLQNVNARRTDNSDGFIPYDLMSIYLFLSKMNILSVRLPKKAKIELRLPKMFSWQKCLQMSHHAIFKLIKNHLKFP